MSPLPGQQGTVPTFEPAWPDTVTSGVLGYPRAGEIVSGKEWIGAALIGALTLAIVIPTKISGRGPEDHAVGMLRELVNAQNMYRALDKDGNGVHDYAASVRALKGLLGAAMTTEEPQHGYVVIVTATADRFAARATPERERLRHFFVDESGVIRASKTGPATATDPPIADKRAALTRGNSASLLPGAGQVARRSRAPRK